MASNIENNKDKIFHYIQEGQLELWAGDIHRSKEAFKKSSELTSQLPDTPISIEIKNNINYYLQKLDNGLSKENNKRIHTYEVKVGDLSIDQELQETITFNLLPLGLQVFEIRGRIHGFEQDLGEISLKRRKTQDGDLNNRIFKHPEGILSANFFKWMVSLEEFSVSASINLKDSTLYGRLTANYFFEGTKESWDKLNSKFIEKFIKTVPIIINELKINNT